MAQFESGPGGIDDRVRLVLNGDEIFIAESYHARVTVFEQPDAFSLRLGSGDNVAALMKRFPPKTPFALFIGDVAAMSGFTDGYEAAMEPATELTIEGRDIIATLYDDHLEREQSFIHDTYKQLVQKQMVEAGLDPALLVTDAAADRQVRAGVPISQLAPPVTVDLIEQDAGGHPVTGLIEQSIKNHLGERRLAFIRRYLDRAGLFLRASHNGGLILSAPNTAQAPVARIVRGRGDKPRPSNIIGSRLRNNTRSRYSEAVLYGRGGGKRHGRTKAKGAFTDDEMLASAADGGAGLTPYTRRLVIRDANVQTTKQAEFLAARKLAEGRRDGWVLTYRLSGHTYPALGSKERGVYTPDTIITVDDDELDVHANLYLESVEFSRGPQSETVLRLQRPEDLLFGNEGE